MTHTQYHTLFATLQRVEAKIDAVEDRLAHVYPTSGELRDQLDREVDSILGCGVHVLADD